MPSQELLLSEDIIQRTQLLSVSEQLNVINSINSQRSEDANTLITALEKKHAQQPLANVDALRLSLLRCFNLLEFGELDQAISLSKQGELSARELKYDSARPYFMLCEASARQTLGQMLQEQLLTEEALRLAKRYSEKQAIVNSLYLKSRQNTSLENYNQSIEDLRLALDLFDESLEQFQHWYLLPKSFFQLEISSVFFSMGDLLEAVHFAELAAEDNSAFGSLNFAFSINLSRIYIELDNKKEVQTYLKKAESENSRKVAEKDLAIGHALLAAINIYLNNFDIAEKQALSSIEVLTKYQEPLYVMRIKRTLAKVYFAQQKDAQALALLHEIIEQATQAKQFSDLEEFNQIVSEYYASKNQFESAYHYQVERVNAAKQANSKLNNAHFMQYKAQLTAQNDTPQTIETPTISLGQNLAIAALIILLLSIGLVLFLIKKPLMLTDNDKEETQEQRINALLNNAKQGHYQLSMLLVNVNHMRQVDMPHLMQQFQHTLREQDQLFRHNLDEVIILLPHTSTEGATRVMHQIEQVLTQWPADNKKSIGIANLQLLDTFEGLMKKAVLNQLSKMKPQDTSST